MPEGYAQHSAAFHEALALLRQPVQWSAEDLNRFQSLEFEVPAQEADDFSQLWEAAMMKIPETLLPNLR